MTVSIVIPHRNRCALLERLLQSIHAQRLPEGVSLDVVVVDNGSEDNSVETARRAGCRVLELSGNEGVSRAVNRGIEASSGEWIALVNNDVELSPGWMAELLAAVGSPPREAAKLWFATGKTLNDQDRGLIDGTGDAICRGGASWRLGHGRADGPLFDAVRRTYFPSATAAIFRRGFFERVGGLEESFFAYLEDIDLGLRAAMEDLPGLYVPSAVAYHRGSATAGIWSGASVEWMTCHQLLLLAKFYPARLMLRFLRPILAAQLLWATLAISRGRASSWARGFWRGLRGFSRLRRASASIRSRGERLAGVLCAMEAEIARVQKATRWDTYWRWYFRLAPLAEKQA
ncbi:MAG: glycosyltransferase family 2 protein [Bryobacterales bacterium]